MGVTRGCDEGDGDDSGGGDRVGEEASKGDSSLEELGSRSSFAAGRCLGGRLSGWSSLCLGGGGGALGGELDGPRDGCVGG